MFAAHTHTQPAQPSTVAHYLLAIIEQLERDAVRLQSAYASTNRNPLGACAITGTGFPIDRVANRGAAGIRRRRRATPTAASRRWTTCWRAWRRPGCSLAGFGRVVQDLLLWCTHEFGYLRLGDGFVQGSSIMPQKRNPVALEHARAIGSKALGQTGAILLAVHNTPFGDIVDTEDDLQPLVTAMFKDATRALRLVAAAMADASFNREKLAERAEQNWITVTELADTLVRDHDAPFRQSHAIAQRFVAECTRRPDAPRAGVLREASKAVLGRAVVYTDAELAGLLSARHFVEVRTTYGGPAPSETARAIGVSRELLARDAAWLAATRGGLSAAATTLKSAAAAL